MTSETPLGEIVGYLDQAGISHMIVGSFASTYYGPPRTTQDIDLVVDIAAPSLERFIELLDKDSFYLPEASARDAVPAGGQFNVIDLRSTWKLDLMVLRDEPFAVSQFARRRVASIDGVQVFVATAEDTVLAKLVWSKIGGSERQLRDVSGILAVMAGDLDEDYLDRWADELGVRETLDRLRADQE